MVCTLSRVGDVEHHQHAMTVLGLSLSAEPSAHYPIGVPLSALILVLKAIF
jgi:hypothetical protein